MDCTWWKGSGPQSRIEWCLSKIADATNQCLYCLQIVTSIRACFQPKSIIWGTKVSLTLDCKSCESTYTPARARYVYVKLTLQSSTHVHAHKMYKVTNVYILHVLSATQLTWCTASRKPRKTGPLSLAGALVQWWCLRLNGWPAESHSLSISSMNLPNKKIW